MDDFERFISQHWSGWETAEVATVREAACLLGGVDPAKYRESNRVLPRDAEAYETALLRSIQINKLKPLAAWTFNEDGRLEPVAWSDIGPHTLLANATTVMTSDLAAWADRHGITQYWRAASAAPAALDLSKLPPELRAALEAFEAVHGNPKATEGRSPKSALMAWLQKNRSDLSAGAIDRIATVANWRPTGGAPKTP